jgi:AcrR family transcriptional regulator
VSDEQVFAAAHRAMNRLPPWEFTLGEIAGEAGVTAGALVQRFGSKRGLLLALMKAWSGGTRAMLDQVRAANASPLAAVRAWGDCLAQLGDSPAGMAHHLAWLQQDMADPAFRRQVQAQTRETTVVLRSWLEQAIEAGELSRAADPAALARALQALLGGSLISWGFLREGTAQAWLRRDLDVVLQPWLVQGPGPLAAGGQQRAAERGRARP